MRNEKVDVLIVGAGLSGIGAACHLKREAPHKSFAILEARDAMGGTWDLFRYPGIRSDSDMYTLGYNFKPWTNPKAIADGPSILSYIKETASEYHIDSHIRYGHQVKHASWSTPNAEWTVEVFDKAKNEAKTISANFVIGCTGYYNYEHGYEPKFEGKEDFKGQVIHPQQWPKDLDYSGKKVVVIGSGATAVTIVPAMTDKAAHVTMLQRSPTYMMSLPEKDKMLNTMREYLPEQWVYRFARTRNVAFSTGFYQFCRRFPEKARELIEGQVKRQLGADFDMKHFTPEYNPWDERLCAVTNGDMFKAIKRGQASVVTDHIDKFTETGILLKSGEELEADIIITATGLDVKLMGGVTLDVDGQDLDVSEKMVYKGVLLEDLPNMGMIFGYTNASWTLKADLISEYMFRIIKHMDKKGMRQVTPRNTDRSLHLEPFIDMRSGYIQRALGSTPKQGSRMPWKLYQNYLLDMAMLRFGSLSDKTLQFTNPATGRSHAAASAA
ncbi:MAG: NAD(P)/FAD-dependent oxidoreductase [Pseudomonadales bacterium]|nr:NAD(P)/FAD-dependent oxidoreductase [Pseudomonadales bacterium]